MTKQAIIYTRFSPRPNADECTSCEKQKERCISYCQGRGYDSTSGFDDENVSGGLLWRPGLQEALAVLEPGMVFVVDSSDRLARDPAVAYAILAQINEAGATIEYANGQPADQSPEGKLVQGVFILLASYQRDCIRLRTKQGLDKKRKNGERTTGKIPIGWMLDPNDPKRLVRCAPEREAIKSACRLATRSAARGFSSARIADILNTAHGGCRGKPWSPRTVRKLIEKHSYWADPVDGDSSLEPDHP